LDSFISEFLTFIEQREARLLSWGFYDVSFDVEELEEIFEAEAPSGLKDAWNKWRHRWPDMASLCDEMDYAGLLFRPETGIETYRSRFAEGVRLTARLRQMFQAKDWATGPNLVSDIKLHLEPRRYPNRDELPQDCLLDLEPIFTIPRIQTAAFEALSADSSGRVYDGFAGFQRRAFKHILSQYARKGISGSVVCAGTGSGKTKAFYIPAFLGMMADLHHADPFTKVIAIYPRNVLLADQLREALSEAEKVRPVLQRFGLRPFTFGALLGSTPYENWFKKDRSGKYSCEKYGWKRVVNGFVVPFLKSPKEPDQALVWRDADREAMRTSLYRSTGTANEPDVPDKTLIVTREQLRSAPPDVLFLSLEMLNREIGNPEWSNTFGMRRGDLKPRLLLLDEVHAYEGVTGGQAAWVLRRWRFWGSHRNLHVVGLSATLKEAPKHLGLVTGIPPSSIKEFQPRQDELTIEGMEYNLLVKGDPTSGASLLATSIQCGMLLARLMTPKHQPPTGTSGSVRGDVLFGRKVFGFTDNLDGLNRWYSDMVDAEQKRRLAKLRLHPDFRRPRQEVLPAVLMQMQRQGQVWDLPRKLGHDLTQSLMVTRCSSQDPGASAGSDIIVASSSLEVGYDDPEVGAILHHKKPTSLSSFIQRRGRAGRKRGVRPWTVVVLSDYGGDRWAFQQSERLFLPEIDSIFLPITNPYILRVQAAYFLVDWLGRRIGRRSPFAYLKPSDYSHSEVRTAIRILEDFLDQGPEWKEFRRDFAALFSQPFGKGGRLLSEMELDAIIWNAPRPLLRSAVPTLLRKLQSNFAYADPGKPDLIEDKGVSHPLPGYLPSATFAELDISEVTLEFPGEQGKEPEYMSISRALFETCPGRVSKRFSVAVKEKGYWHHFSENLLGGIKEAAVRDIFPQSLFLETVGGVDVYRPLSITLLARPQAVLESSNSFWKWQSTFRTIAGGLGLPIFKSGKFKGIFKDCRAYLHRDQSGIELLRYTHSCGFEIRRSRKDPLTGRLELRSADQGLPVKEAIGFKQQVDGIALHMDPSCLKHPPEIPSDGALRFRVDYFLDLIKASDHLADLINPFLAEWLWQTSLAMLTATALRNGCSLQDAQARLHSVRAEATRRVLDVIFQVRSGSEEDDTDTKLKQKLLALWTDSTVCEHMTELEKCLWTEPGQKYTEWIRRRYGATLAQAFRTGVVSRLSEVSEDDLMVDLELQEDGGAFIYLTETSSGGLGQIEMAVHELMQHPDLFHEGFRHALTYCSRDYIADNLTRAVASVVTDRDCLLSDAFARVRTARGFHAQETARDMLQAALEEMGFPASRSAVVSIITRLLQYGSSEQTDAMIHFQNKAIRKHSIRLGLNLDPRVFAYLCVNYLPAKRRLARLFEHIGGVEPNDGHIFAILQRFFITTCRDACSECLDQPNRFNDFGRPSRTLASLWLNLEAPVVSAESEGWVPTVLDALREHGHVELLTGTAHITDVSKTVQAFLAEELEIDYLLLPISIAGIKRYGAEWKITLKVKETGHVYP
jgi:hypothetical protein